MNFQIITISFRCDCTTLELFDRFVLYVHVVLVCKIVFLQGGSEVIELCGVVSGKSAEIKKSKCHLKLHAADPLN